MLQGGSGPDFLIIRSNYAEGLVAPPFAHTVCNSSAMTLTSESDLDPGCRIYESRLKIVGHKPKVEPFQ